MLSKNHAILLHAVLIVHVDRSATLLSALASQAIWEFHRNVDLNAYLALNALLHKHVSTSNAKILVPELAAEMPNAK